MPGSPAHTLSRCLFGSSRWRRRCSRAGERYVARGVARLGSSSRGRRALHRGRRRPRYLDFAGGIGCQNLGHGPPTVVARDPRAGRPLPAPVLHGRDATSRTSRSAGGSPSSRRARAASSSAAPELRRRGGRERGQDRARRDRPARRSIVFDRGFHGRTLLTMAMTARSPYKQGFGPFAPEVYRAPAPYPYRGVSTDDALAGLARLFKRGGRLRRPSPASCSSRSRARAASSRCRRLPAALRELCDEHGILYVDDEVQAGVGRTGPVWAIEHYGVEPDLLVSGKSLGGGLPLAARHRPAPRSWTRPGPAGSAAPSAATRSPARRRARPRHGRRARVPRARRGARAVLAQRLDRLAARHPDRRAPRPRPDARARARRAGPGARRGGRGGRARARPGRCSPAASTGT